MNSVTTQQANFLYVKEIWLVLCLKLLSAFISTPYRPQITNVSRSALYRKLQDKV